MTNVLMSNELIQELFTYKISNEELTDAERTYYEYHGKLDDGNHLVDAYEAVSIEGSVLA